MSEPKQIRTLAVHLHSVRIGVINHLAGDRQLFAFDKEYGEEAGRPTLSLSYKGRSGQLITRPRSYITRVPPFFSNMLPEGHLRRYLAERAGVKPEREFFLLAALGADLPGAVTVIPLDENEQASVPLNVDRHDNTVDQSSDTVMRFSLAGIQLKFSAVLESSGGLTIPADGMGGSWIIKLPSARFHAVPENEFVMLELARAVGIDVPDIKLISLDQINGLPRDTERMVGSALAVERFDRLPDGQRIHMEDFAQIFGHFPEGKYENCSYANIASVLWAEAGDESTYEFVRRLTFSVLIGNADMHLKNWSILYPDKRTPVLAPAYDFVSTIPYLPDDKLALTLGGSRNLHGLTKDQIRRFADRAGLPVSPVWDTVRQTVERTVEAWDTLDERSLLSADMLAHIEDHLKVAARATNN